MTLTLTIEMDNAAFDGVVNRHDEAARILRVAAKRIQAGAWAMPLMDINGNKVGKVEVAE